MAQSTEIQSLLFLKSKWTVASAKKWLRDNKKLIPKVDSTDEYYRFRQRSPSAFKPESFRTISLGSSSKGIRAVVARPKKQRNPKRTSKRKRSWTPSLLVDIAIPLVVDLEDGRQYKFPLSGNFSLAATKNGRELWIISKRGAKKVETEDEKAERLYETFTGFEHDPVGDLIQLGRKTLRRISRCMSITYRSDKFSKSGNYTDYIHAFNVYPAVSVDNEKTPSVVVLRGGDIRIRQEGITG
jgi:hypothetical protein